MRAGAGGNDMVLHQRIAALLGGFLTSGATRRVRLDVIQARWGRYLSRAKGTFACLGVLLLFGADGGMEREISCLALNIYFEARLEPESGRRAVAHVVMNRVRDRRWPGSPCAVVRQGGTGYGPLCQFSWYCDGRSNTPRRNAYWDDALLQAERVYWGRSADPTDGALWYHATYVAPRWRHALTPGPRIGNHIFYHDGA